MFAKHINRMIALAILSASPLVLSACQTVPEVPSLENTTVDEKALYVAESAFSVGSKAIEVATDSGVLKGEKAATVSDLYAKAYVALLAMRTAQKAGNSGDVLAQALLVQSLVTQIFGLLA